MLVLNVGRNIDEIALFPLILFRFLLPFPGEFDVDLEINIPVQIVPFAELGHGWDDAATLPAETLASFGLGFRISPWEWLLAEAYWGSELFDIPGPSHDDIQDDGFYIRVTITPF